MLSTSSGSRPDRESFTPGRVTTVSYTHLAIWVHCAFATETYFVYQLVQFMRNVPRDLDEACLLYTSRCV